ncbi:MAG: fluoride efflux transporter CrcB [Alphaproteobacteria bacterium]|nr:fluoride efflux transporter CrcB [Alphaproteobacteria bacterium]
MSFYMFLAVACGGAVGASARYVVSIIIGELLGKAFPYGTMTVNIIGSLVMGVLLGLMAMKWNVSQELRSFLIVGVMGGFTTFSSFSMDFAYLFEKGEMMHGFYYVAGSVLLGLGAFFTGMQITKSLLA